MELSDRERLLTTLGVLFGVFLAAIEATVVATAMPTAIGSIGSIALIHYVFASYQLATVSTITVWGKLADTWGLRKSFLAGGAFFLTGSALCGMAQSVPHLILFRFIQGVGAGALFPVAQTTLGRIYSEVRRAKLQVYLSMVWAIASVAGPPIGAFLTEYFSWRWVFYLNLPAGLLSLYLVHSGLRQYQDDAQSIKSFDWMGSALVFLGVSSLIAAISVDRNGRFLFSWPIITAFTAFSLIMLALLPVHSRKAAKPFLSPAVLTNPVLRRAGLGSFFMCMAIFGTIAFIPLFCQEGLKQSVAGAGRTLSAFLFGWIASSAASAKAYLKYSMRALARTGAAIMTGAFAMLALNLPGISVRTFSLCLFILGIGMGISFAPLLLGVQSAVPKNEMGSGTASLQLLRNLGGLIGVTLLGTLLVMNPSGAHSALAQAAQGIHVSPILAMTRVFFMDAALTGAALVIVWNLPPISPKH